MNTALMKWVTIQVDQDFELARSAIRKDRPGTHWQWVTDETDRAIEPGRVSDALEQTDEDLSLRTVEEFPTQSRGVGDLPAFIINMTADLPDTPGALDHIAEWDPARVLGEVKFKRLLLNMILGRVLQNETSDRLLRMLADTYEHRGGRPDG